MDTDLILSIMEEDNQEALADTKPEFTEERIARYTKYLDANGIKVKTGEEDMIVPDDIRNIETMYKYLTTSQGNTQLFETATESVIDTYKVYREAVKRGKFYTRGGGFFGFTPRFMTVQVKKDFVK